jgi:hypothetical protein
MNQIFIGARLYNISRRIKNQTINSIRVGDVKQFVRDKSVVVVPARVYTN